MAFKKFRIIDANYLNAGSGKPCAGHTRAIDDNSENTTVRLLSVEENFGLALPIGSRVFEIYNKLLLRKMIT